MRALLLFPLLALTSSVVMAQTRQSVSVCVWENARFGRVSAYYDGPARTLFATPAGAERFADRHPADSTRGYARTMGWYVGDAGITVAESRLASFRGAGGMDETKLVPAGTFGGAPVFRRPTDTVETLYVLVGPGFRPEGPAPYVDGGRCEFQPYRRLAPPTASTAQE